MTGKPIDTTWCLNQYRNKYDSQEIWELKRSFMQKYQSEIPETELVCLAQTMVNMEVLQCRYPQEIVDRIESMGAKMLKRYRKLRANRIQRNFIDASVAAATFQDGEADAAAEDRTERKRKAKTPDEDNEIIDEKIPKLDGELDKVFTHKFGRLILFDKSAIDGCDDEKQEKRNLLFFSALKCKIPINSTFKTLPNDESQYDLYLNNELIASGTHADGEAAKNLAIEGALDELSRLCYTLKLKCLYVANEEDLQPNAGDRKNNALDYKKNKLGEKNIGFRLLKSWGWSGEGGLRQDSAPGIAEPLAIPVPHPRRGGIGTELTKSKKKGRLEVILDKFLTSEETIDCVFKGLKKTNRQYLNLKAPRMNCKIKEVSSPSYAKRTMVIISKKRSIFEVARVLLSTDHNLEHLKMNLLKKFELIPPKMDIVLNVINEESL